MSIDWSFIPRGNDTRFTVVLLVRFGALAEIRVYQSAKGTCSSRRSVASKSLRVPKSWELIPPSEGWMCEGDEEENDIAGMEPSVGKKDASKEDPEEEEDLEEDIPASSSLPMDIDATEDYLRFIEDLERLPEYSPIRSSQASVPDSPEEPSDRLASAHDTSSYDFSGVWKAPSSGPSL
ncbi:hypothetical protein PIB30_062487 [Stylosanthes scabra]|uniref:Uncharacterized protein n=1 Tax=Stylosanthes scabra TaxID=79078 RepID=A0ABU6RLJ4_9FABA|nr:hypothetical protein [Stylosanthes scabra]